MVGWVRHSESWRVRVECLAPDRWLKCYKRPEEKRFVGPAHWVYVMDRESEVIERHCIEAFDPLMMECIAHEMRKKHTTTP